MKLPRIGLSCIASTGGKYARHLFAGQVAARRHIRQNEDDCGYEPGHDHHLHMGTDKV